MIVVKLIGGLGNQMFQYAAARRLALKHNTALKLDVSPFSSYALRQYGLHAFTLEENFSSPKDISRFHPSLVEYAARKFLGLTRYRIISENASQYGSLDETVLSAPDNCYLNGFWQSEAYFADIASEIRRDFRFREDPVGCNVTLAKEISDRNSVCVHVRRGDYVENGCILPTIDYYRNAIALIAERVKGITLYIFSDDLPWCRENLRTEFPTEYIGHNQGAAVEDLRLMTLCRHFVIANSTFSWWGAWLAANPEKIVCAPVRWAAHGNMEHVVPYNWHRL